MKIFPILLTLALITRAVAAPEDLPTKPPVSSYAHLWNNSPFTTKPPDIGQGPEVNPLEDYALGGVSPIAGGHRITLFNRKVPDERIVIDPSTPSSFRVISINRQTGNPLGTTVRLATAGKEGVVSFDEKLLVLKAAAAQVQPQPQNNGQQIPGQQVPGQPPGENAPRQPRPRVVPPPNAGAAQNPQQLQQQQRGNQRPSAVQQTRPSRR